MATFDTLKLAVELEKAGMSWEQAVGVTKALRDALNEHYQYLSERLKPKV